MVSAMQARRDGGQPDLDRAVTVLGDNLRLLTGQEPVSQRLVRGHRHVHRMALSWPSAEDARICLQVLPDPRPHSEDGTVVEGWPAADARAVAESLDLKLRHGSDTHSPTDFNTWRRATDPAYYAVVLDPAPSTRPDAELTRRCALLESGYVDGAGWLRFYADGQFAEGSFTRVLERAAHEIRGTPGVPAPPPDPQGTHLGLC